MTTKTEYKRFRQEVDRVSGVLNFADWNIATEMRDIGNAHGQAKHNAAQRTALVSLSDTLPKHITPECVARHEMAHLFVATLDYLGGCRWCDESELDLEVEKLACIMEKLKLERK